MKETTEKAIKEEIGYTEDICPSCQNCEHSEEKENLHVDRDWYWVCNLLFPLDCFSVRPNARCNKFNPKQTK